MSAHFRRALILLAASILVFNVNPRAPSLTSDAQAQESPDDDDDEEDDDDDLGGDGGGDDDVGNDGSDDTGSDDGGDDGATGDDDAGPGGDDDSPGADDDDGPGGDDDDGPGGDDDDGPGGDDDGPGGDDDEGLGGDDDDDGPGGDDDNDDVEDGDFVDGLSNVPPDGVELDSDGDWIRAGEILALEADPTSLEFARSLGFRVVERHQLTTLGVSIVELRVPRGVATGEALEALRRGDPNTAYDYNHVYLPTQTVPLRPRVQQSVGAQRTSAAAIPGNIGIVDTAVDANHPALSNAQIVQASFVDRAETLAHGTAVTSLLVENGAGTQGTVFAATVVEGGSSRGNAFGTAESLVRGLDWLARNDAAVVNVSLAGPPNMLLEDAVRRARARGILIVAAVGNDGPAAPPLYPAAYEGVVGVTAVDDNNVVYRRAGRGAHVDFAAPGVGVSVANPSGEYSAVSGTSYASPVVAAALARRHPRPNERSAQAAIRALNDQAEDAGDAGLDPVYGAGVIRPASR